MGPMTPFSSPHYTRADRLAFLSELKPGVPGQDPQQVVREFEAAIAKKVGVPPAWVVCVNSATAALATWYNTSIGGLTVESSVLTWPATYSCAPRYALVDCDHEGWPVWSSRKDVARVLVELWGRVAPLDTGPTPHGGIIIDASHNAVSARHGVLLKQGAVRAVVYSFGPIKQLSCVRGGCLISHEVTPLLRAFTDSGTVGKDAIGPCGFNFEMAEPNAALGLSQLKRFDVMQAHRHSLLQVYRDALVTLHGRSGHLAVLECATEVSRMKVVGALLSAGYAVGHHYPLPLHLPQSLYPRALDLSRRVLSLPIHMGVTLEQAAEVVRIVKGAI